MNLLLSNDDGIQARGFSELEAAVAGLGTLWAAAPDSPRSAQSHALTMHKPIRAKPRGERRWAISGTPADCVYLALHHLLERWPRLVLSGINHGSNLSNDVFYSGTVAAAMEGCLTGVPAIAFSLHIDPESSERHWETARHVVRDIVTRVLLGDLPIPQRTMLNVNIPPVPLDQLKGLCVAPLGQRHYGPSVLRRDDPWGKPYFWLGGREWVFGDMPDADGPKLLDGWATLTPLQPDLTLHSQLDALRAGLRTEPT